MTIRIKILLNVSQLYSIPQFLRASFQEVNYNERAFITLKEQKKDLQFYDHVSWRILEKYEYLQRKVEKWLGFAVMRQKNSSFRLNIVKEADLNTSKKLLVFVTIRQKISSLRPAIIYENFIFTQKYAFAERCCFLTFLFEGKFRKYDIFVKRKHTKADEKNDLFCLFHKFPSDENSFLNAVLSFTHRGFVRFN